MTESDQSAPAALVTGAPGAIGSAIARGLLMRGYTVTITARDKAKGERFAADYIFHSPSGRAFREIESQ